MKVSLKIIRRVAAGLLVATAVAATIAASPAEATAKDKLFWSSQREGTSSTLAKSNSTERMTARSYATTWGACGVFTDNQKIIRTFTRHKGTAPTGQHMRGGKTYLRCGGPKLSENPKWGYRHMLKHRGQWEDKAAKTGQNWREVADYGLEWALKDPDKVTYRADNDTFCYSRIIYLVNKKTGEQVGKMYPNVAVASKSGNEITAFPASKQCR